MLLDIVSHRNSKPVGRIRQKNEQLIISAAEVEFARCGYRGATMNNIADLAGLPKSNIHYYFKSKLQLYAEVLSNIIELWDDALNDLHADAEPAPALRAYITKKMCFAKDYPHASKVFASEILSGAPRLDDYFDDSYRVWFNGRLEVFHEWVRLGKIDPIEPAHIVFMLWSTTQHYSDFEMQIASALGKTKLSDEDFFHATESVARVIIRGIGAKDVGFD